MVPLSRDIIELDSAALRSSPKAITAHSSGRWPVEDVPRDEALRRLDTHQREFETGAAYAYGILSPDRSRELGCVYLRPLALFLTGTGTHLNTARLDADRTAIVTFWLIDDAVARPSTAQILESLRRWLRHWGSADPVFRCLPEEHACVEALNNATGMRPLQASGQELPYRWFAEQVRSDQAT